MYRPKTRIRLADDGALLALIADGEDTPNPLAFLEVAEGAEPLTREQIAEHLRTLSDEDLAAVIEAAIAEGQRIAEDDSTPIDGALLARINALADAREVAEEQRTAIATEAEEAQRQRDEALARLRPPAADGEGDGEGDGDGDNDPGSAEGASAGGAGDGAAAPAGTPEPVAASAPRTGSTASGRRTTALPRPGHVPSSPPPAGSGGGSAPAAFVAPRATTTLVASAGLESIGLSSGQQITTAAQLGEALNRKRHSIRNTRGGDGEQLTVASLSTTFPTERSLGGSLDDNTRRINDATSTETLVASAAAARETGAIVAAGGLCAPLNMDYDVPVLGSVARPVRDALTNFGADRGGVKWRQHLSFGDFAGATSIWTLDMDEAQGDPGVADPTPKPCLSVECPDDAEAFVEAITLCLRFSNINSRFDPEATAANVQAAQIAHARLAENRLLSQLAALSTSLTSPAVVSAIRDDLLGIDRLVAAIRNFYRLDEDVALRAVRPRWWLDAIRADLLLGTGMGSGNDLEALAVAEATINGWYARRGVNVTWHLDGRPATVAAVGTEVTMADQFYAAFTDNGPVPDFPAQVETLMWVEGTMLHLDGGQMDLGVVRDSTLNQTNEYKQFSETFEGVAHRGVEAFRLVQDLQISGMTAGTADTAAILAA